MQKDFCINDLNLLPNDLINTLSKTFRRVKVGINQQRIIILYLMFKEEKVACELALNSVLDVTEMEDMYFLNMGNCIGCRCILSLKEFKFQK